MSHLHASCAPAFDSGKDCGVAAIALRATARLAGAASTRIGSPSTTTHAFSIWVIVSVSKARGAKLRRSSMRAIARARESQKFINSVLVSGLVGLKHPTLDRKRFGGWPGWIKIPMRLPVPMRRMAGIGAAPGVCKSVE
jgi:hypothetical protein